VGADVAEEDGVGHAEFAEWFVVLAIGVHRHDDDGARTTGDDGRAYGVLIALYRFVLLSKTIKSKIT